jgi:putative phosphoribosyl transferase
MPKAVTHVRQHVPYPRQVFADRAEAGAELARFAVDAADPSALVLALPPGGVPVAAPVAAALGCELRPVLVRKLPVPSSPQAGFGAVTLDGTVVLNERLTALLGILPETVERVAAEVRRELERRADVLPGGRQLPEMRGRRVWLVDDGLATGYSAVAAARMARAHGATSLTLAVPVTPEDSLALLASEADEVFCLIVQDAGAAFAVASFYRDFHDLTDDEVSALLR